MNAPFSHLPLHPRWRGNLIGTILFWGVLVGMVWSDW